ncbi:DUF4129 domain-containing protein [Mycobacterium sp.]|uniref:DUF4129 domain-containing protein n=1 Tax=Mycobacterium sp. TaxID=1785 RepID=UPI003F9ACB39
MFDKATGRVVAVIVLLMVIAASLRGYLPGVERAVRKRPPDDGASLVYVIAMLSVSVVILAVAVIARLRDPRKAAPSAGGLPERFSDGRGRPSWRVLVIGAGVLVAWLLAVWLLSQFVVLHTAGQAPTGPASTAPTPANNAPRPPEPPEVGGGGDLVRYLIASTLALLVLIVVGAVVAARRRRVAVAPIVAPEPVGPLTPTGTSESLARAAEVGLAEIGDRAREPREAIIACYAAMERELAYVPAAVPQDFDTPTEVLARAVENHALHVDNAVELVNLFEEARFSPHVMNEAHRENAVGVLQLVLAELRSVV